MLQENNLIMKESTEENMVSDKSTIAKLVETNDYEYNLLKTVEELSELSEVLMKKVLKSEKEKEPSDQSIIDEIGDVYIRIRILSRLFGEEAVSERVNFKLDKFETYLKEGKYQGGI